MYLINQNGWLNINLTHSTRLTTHPLVGCKSTVLLNGAPWKPNSLNGVSNSTSCLVITSTFSQNPLNADFNFCLYSRSAYNKIQKSLIKVWFGFTVFNATFNNISVISWQSVLMVEETGEPWENHRPVASHWQTLSLFQTLMLYRVHLAMNGVRTHKFNGDRYWLHREL